VDAERVELREPARDETHTAQLERWLATGDPETLRGALLAFDVEIRECRESNVALRRLNERYEEDARRISHAIHAQAGQLLASAAIMLETVGRELPDKRDALLHVAALLDEVHHELRRLSHELRPPLLDQLGLMPALRFLAERVGERWGVSVRVYGQLGNRPRQQVETAIYRIVEEALRNVVEHSGASAATIRIWKEPDWLTCSVRDRGKGFDTRAAAATGAGRGLGLIGIRERLRELGGILRIDAATGRGTDLVIMIPEKE
jgi:signal transduction histidine kinase